MHTVRWSESKKLWAVCFVVVEGEVAKWHGMEYFADKANAYAFASYLNGGAFAPDPGG